MKLHYKVEDVGNNIYQAYPQSLESCCNQSLLWFMRGTKSWNVVNAYIIQPLDGKATENYHYCQFCGEKHEAVEIKKQEKNLDPSKDKPLL